MLVLLCAYICSTLEYSLYQLHKIGLCGDSEIPASKAHSTMCSASGLLPIEVLLLIKVCSALTTALSTSAMISVAKFLGAFGAPFQTKLSNELLLFLESSACL